MSKTKEKKGVCKGILKTIEVIVTLILLVITLIILTQRISDNKYSFLGYKIFRVETGSMIPKYLIGDVLLVKYKDPNQLTVGEDVVYTGKSGTTNGKIITHQLIQIEEEDGQKIFHTKGIANSSEDPIVYEDQINGIVLGKMTILTLFCRLLTNRLMTYFLVILPLTIYIFFRIIHIGLIKTKDGKE